jgi:hypothetical protein
MRGRPLVAVLVLVTVLAQVTAASARSRFSTAGSGARLGTQTNAGCCDDPDVQNFGVHLDFTSVPEDSELTQQHRSSGILFGRGASSLAPRTFVRVDYARVTGCQRVLNGDPTFSGWEFMIFADSVDDRWAAVQRIGADVGYCDQEASCFLAAYDVDGNMIDIVFNENIGFQFLSIERPSAEICRVMVGDCLRSGSVCYPDDAGSALNCLTFSTPVSLLRPLPVTVPVPGPPTIQTSPIAGAVPLATSAVLVVGFAAWSLSRDRRRRRAED